MGTDTLNIYTSFIILQFDLCQSYKQAEEKNEVKKYWNNECLIEYLRHQVSVLRNRLDYLDPLHFYFFDYDLNDLSEAAVGLDFLQ